MCSHYDGSPLAMPSQPFKYAAHIDSMDPCPPTEAKAIRSKLYRFVHDPMITADFLPVALLPTRPRNDPAGGAGCSEYGLSLFVSAEKAERRYRALISGRPNLVKRLGTHLAVGEIVETDGVVTPESRDGHVCLHEYEGVDLLGRFTICKCLISDEAAA